MQAFEPNLEYLEVALTYLCNVACANCCALSPQAPPKDRKTEDMNLDDITRFIHETVQANYRWSWVKLHGGEPTLHPQYKEIVTALAAWRNASSPGTRLSVVSNGRSPELVRFAMEHGFTDLVSVKIGTNAAPDDKGKLVPLPYVPVNKSPKDLGVPAPSGCYIAQDCGIALNKQGFWPCAPAAAAARVFGYDAPVKHVQDITAERLKTLYSHCDHCGFALEGEPRVVDQVYSPTWKSLIDRYNED